MYGLPSPKSAIVSTSPRSWNASGSPLAAKDAASVGGGTSAGSSTDRLKSAWLAGVGEQPVAQRGVDERVHADADRRDGQRDEHDEGDRQPRPEPAHRQAAVAVRRRRRRARGLVAGAANGQDQRRRGGIGLDLRPQPPDRDVDEPRVAEVVVAPDAVEEQRRG